MARYFVHFDANGKVHEDESGTEFLTATEMRKEVKRMVPAIAKDDFAKDGETLTYKVLVYETDNRPVYAVVMTLVGMDLKQP